MTLVTRSRLCCVGAIVDVGDEGCGRGIVLDLIVESGGEGEELPGCGSGLW